MFMKKVNELLPKNPRGNAKYFFTDYVSILQIRILIYQNYIRKAQCLLSLKIPIFLYARAK